MIHPAVYWGKTRGSRNGLLSECGILYNHWTTPRSDVFAAGIINHKIITLLKHPLLLTQSQFNLSGTSMGWKCHDSATKQYCCAIHFFGFMCGSSVRATFFAIKWDIEQFWHTWATNKLRALEKLYAIASAAASSKSDCSNFHSVCTSMSTLSFQPSTLKLVLALVKATVVLEQRQRVVSRNQ